MIKTSEVKDKERILKTARKNKLISYRGQARSVQSDEKQGPTT